MFRLSKWYLDVVAEDGTAFVGYSARLRWGALRVRYAATLLARPGSAPAEGYTLFRTPAPAFGPGGRLGWECPPLRIAGHWTPTAPPVTRSLYDGPAGTVLWDCVAPAAQVRLQTGDGAISGLGYAERLRMTAKPWTLPLEELLWGRFLAPGAALVWIDWRGPVRQRLVVRDGVVDERASVDDASIDLADGARLGLELARPLREGPLIDVLSAVPVLAKLLPDWLARSHESKRLSRGRLAAPGAAAREGWAIHEVVKWPSPVRV